MNPHHAPEDYVASRPRRKNSAQSSILSPRDSVDAWEVAAALVAAPTLPEKLRLLLAAAPRIGEADSATIYLRDDVSGAPRAIAQYGFELDVFGPPRVGGYTERVLRTGEVVVVNDVAADPDVNPVVPAAGVRAFVALPLFTRRRSDAVP